MAVNIPSELKSRSSFLISIALGLEKGTRFSQVSTVIRSMAKYIDLPSLSVSDAKTHAIACQNSVGTATPANQTITIDTKSDNSVDYCEEDLRGDKAGFKLKTRNRIRNTIMKKINTDWATNILAGATAVTGTVDLSSSAKVSDFLSGLAVDANDVYFDWAPSVQNGRVETAKFHGGAFVVAGTTAYKTLLSANNQTRFLSTTEATKMRDAYFVSGEGVVVINAGSAFSDPKQLVYGVAGAPVHAYRADNLKEFDDKITSRTTAAADSGDVTAGDNMVQRDYNMGAEIYHKPLVPTSVAAYVKKQLMA